ncbi:MAG: serine hydrolase domain-containing protein [Phycisphaerales bacterium]
MRLFWLVCGLFVLGSARGVALASGDEVVRSRVHAHNKAPFPYAAPAGAGGLSERAIESLGDQVAEWVATGENVGAEVLVVKDGLIAWHETFGVRDLVTGEPLEPVGIYRVRSMTKPVLGTAVLRLVGDGTISLDDPIAEHIPAFDAQRTRDITVRRLLSHTGGFEFSSFPVDRASYETLRESVDDLATVEPHKPVGAFAYSDGGSAALGAIVESASADPLEVFIEREIFVPLGMGDSHTEHVVGSPWASRIVSTHRWRQEQGGHRRYWDPSDPQDLAYFRASGGMYSTVFDYAVFLDAWRRAYNGEDTDVIDPALARTALARIPGVPYGLHWEVAHRDDGTLAVFGHSGSDGTMALCVPDENLLVLFFTQSRGCDCRDQFAMLAGLTGEFGPLNEILTWGVWREPSPSINPVAMGDDAAAKYEGWYDMGRGTVRIDNDCGALRMRRGVRAPNEPDDDARESSVVCRPALALPFPVDLVPIGEHTFVQGRIEDGEVVEVYWPGRPLVFAEREGEIVGYEVEYEPMVVERARKYTLRLADPPRRREPIPDDIRETFTGRYESGIWGVIEVRISPDAVEFVLGSRVDQLWHQGDGFYVGPKGEVSVFDLDERTGVRRLRIRDIDGSTYEYRMAP